MEIRSKFMQKKNKKTFKTSLSKTKLENL